MQLLLTRREYLGEGYIHVFVNDKTGEQVIVETTQKEYELLSGTDGSLHIPQKEGHTWISSCGGTVKVDSPSSILGENEYTEIGEEAHFVFKDTEDELKAKVVPKSQIVENTIWQ